MMDPWHVVETLAVGFLAVLWWMARDHAAEAKGRITKLEVELADVRKEAARSEERDKAFADGIARLTRAIDEFDRRVGAKIDELARVVGRAERSMSPPAGIPKTRYKFIPNDEDK